MFHKTYIPTAKDTLPGTTLSMHKDIPIRNRPILILLLPAIIFLFATGWLLFTLGERRRKPPQQAKRTTTKEDKIEIHIAMTEEPEETTTRADN